MVHPDLHAILRPWLLPGERLLWAGRPKRGLLLRRADLSLVPISFVLAAIALLGLSTAWQQVRDLSDPLFVLPAALIALVSLHPLVGRFAVDALVRSRLVYAVSDRRVLIFRTGPFASFRSIDLDYLPMLELEEGAGGRGTLLFDVPPSDWLSRGESDWTPALSKTPRFLAIDGARTVYDLIAREAERLRRERLAHLPPGRAALLG